MKKNVLFGALSLVASLVVSSAAHAALTKSLFLGADENLNGVLTDIIGSDARFDVSNSSVFDARSNTPTLAFLSQFDSVLFWTNYFPNDSITLGNILADYVDGGGRVVRATFVGQEVPDDGRIATTGYGPFTSGRIDAYDAACLGSFDNTSAIMAGVTSICAREYRGDWDATLDAGATLVASWDDTRPFVGINAAANVIDISLFPNVAEYAHANGDYGQLFANALAFDGQISQVPEPASLALVGIALLGIRTARRRNS